MTRIIIAIAAAAALVSFYAASPSFAESCNETATAKKYAGAAKKSFLTKCESEAKAACDNTAAQKKYAGAAKASFTKKCVADAVGG